MRVRKKRATADPVAAAASPDRAAVDAPGGLDDGGRQPGRYGRLDRPDPEGRGDEGRRKRHAAAGQSGAQQSSASLQATLQSPQGTLQPPRGLTARLLFDVTKDNRATVTLGQAADLLVQHGAQLAGSRLDGGIVRRTARVRQRFPSPTACGVGAGVGSDTAGGAVQPTGEQRLFADRAGLAPARGRRSGRRPRRRARRAAHAGRPPGRGGRAAPRALQKQPVHASG